MDTLPEPLAAFADYTQFILYDTNGVPISPITFKNIDPHLPSSWVNAETAIDLSNRYGYGVGFVFTDNDPFFFLDIDDCLINGAWTDLAIHLCHVFSGCAIEVSKSGAGLHIFGTGTPEHTMCKNTTLHLEFYTTKRYAALTGVNMVGSATHTPPDLQKIVDTYFTGTAPDATEWTTEPVNEWNGPEDDQELIKKALQSKSARAAFGGRASFKALWEADADILGDTYPDGGATRPFDYSSADAALLQHLAFWTGKNCERMDRIFRMSGLVRDKWLDREDYRLMSILHATGHCKNVYSSVKKSVSPAAIMQDTATALRDGYQYMAAPNQIELFKGCVYVRDVHRIFTPDGALLKSEQFKAVYGGYVFALDNIDSKTTRNAWDAFTESQAVHFPKAHNVCFRPECEPRSIIEEEDLKLLNTYIPVVTKSTPGDPTPFLNHLNAMLPVEHDRAVLLAYMAACVQYPGVKFQWCPLLQGCEGNGKTIFINCLSEAIGHRYTHLPNASELGKSGSTFNAWIQNKLFIGVEEIYVSGRWEVLEALKTLITNPRLEIQAKGVDQYTGDNRANFFMCSNYKDAIIKTVNDRRYCVFYTAQQNTEDMAAIGWLNTDYFPRLYYWLKSGGYAIVNNYFRSYQIPEELNPATYCQRAPQTSSTNEVIDISRGRIEQDILEAIAEGRAGFCGDWISSMALNSFLEDRRDNRTVPHNKRRELLDNLGFIPHPALHGGRATQIVSFEGGKPRLYVKKGSIPANITDPAAVMDMYKKAQGYTVGEGPLSKAY